MKWLTESQEKFISHVPKKTLGNLEILLEIFKECKEKLVKELLEVFMK